MTRHNRLNIRPLLLLLCLLCTGSMPAYAQEKELLRQVVAQIKSLSTYTYEAHVDVVFPDGKTDRMINTLYMDGPGRQLSYRNKTQVVVLNKKWFYRADHASRTVSVFDVKAYGRRRDPKELSNVFNANSTLAYFLDSVLVRAEVAEVKHRGNEVIFHFTFPESSYVKAFSLGYDQSTKLPTEISMELFYVQHTDPKTRKQTGYRYTVTCKQYSRSIPPKTFDTDPYFMVSGNKVILLQYKNYKVSSIL